MTQTKSNRPFGLLGNFWYFWYFWFFESPLKLWNIAILLLTSVWIVFGFDTIINNPIETQITANLIASIEKIMKIVAIDPHRCKNCYNTFLLWSRNISTLDVGFDKCKRAKINSFCENYYIRISRCQAGRLICRDEYSRFS